MKVTVAMDSFKGSLSSMQAGRAAEQGIRRVFPDAEIFVRPIADGGEGTVDALIEGMGGILEPVEVCGPLGEPVKAGYGIIEQSRTAILEMSAAAGLTLVPPEKRNPMKTTTYGVGEMIADAIHKNCRNFIIGIGGSATNDGGAGMLKALG
ncbi:MAG: glycerate kinase, partial [Clostridia bacterium]|nr:glycerate kinase [Clostridia bacterium]